MLPPSPPCSPASAARRPSKTGVYAGSQGQNYTEYWHLYATPLPVLLRCFRCPQALQNWWLSVWSNATAASEAASASASHLSDAADSVDTAFYLGIYFAFGVGSLALQGGRAVLLVMGTVNAARVLQVRESCTGSVKIPVLKATRLKLKR